jgi:pilus assembly protein CpaE
MSDVSHLPEVPGRGILSVALIGPHEERRKAVSEGLAGIQDIVVQEFSSFPPELNDMPQMLEKHYDVVILDVDSDPDFAYDLAEAIGVKGITSVMAYSARPDVKLAIRFMRAGVREFLTLPLERAEVQVAFNRASLRHPALRELERSAGKLLVFLGAKGGCGVTTIASNFAVALVQESERSTLLVDLGLPLGDVAINLGMAPEFSIADAVKNSSRLDSRFLQSIVSVHDSGLAVLAAPSEFVPEQFDQEAINRLLTIARHNFDFIVVDIGCRLDLMDSVLFEDSAIVYLISQVGISELRNSNRMITRFFANRNQNLQIVLNRYKPATLIFDDKHIEKALTRPTQWKIPDDYAAARRTHSVSTPIALLESPISLALHQMARSACGLPAERESKKGLFSFFR